MPSSDSYSPNERGFSLPSAGTQTEAEIGVEGGCGKMLPPCTPSRFVLIFEIVWHLSGKVLPGGSQCLVMIEQPVGKGHEKLQLQCQNSYVAQLANVPAERYPTKYMRETLALYKFIVYIE